MFDKGQKTIRIKWVRSGIGFSYRQKRIVRSLGLKKLNQEVERPDTPQIRGLVAKVPHLVEIVPATAPPAWTLVPEYTIHKPAAEPSQVVETAPPVTGGESEGADVTASAGTVDVPATATTQGRPGQGAAALEIAPEESGETAAAEESASAAPLKEESPEAGEEASSEEGQPEA